MDPDDKKKKPEISIFEPQSLGFGSRAGDLDNLALGYMGNM